MHIAIREWTDCLQWSIYLTGLYFDFTSPLIISMTFFTKHRNVCTHISFLTSFLLIISFVSEHIPADGKQYSEKQEFWYWIHQFMLWQWVVRSNVHQKNYWKDRIFGWEFLSCLLRGIVLDLDWIVWVILLSRIFSFLFFSLFEVYTCAYTALTLDTTIRAYKNWSNLTL